MTSRTELQADPRTGLKIVPVPNEYAKYFADLTGSIIHWFGSVIKFNQKWTEQNRIAIISNRCVYLCHTNGGITRCVQIQNIECLFLSPEARAPYAIGFKVAHPDYDMLIAVGDKQERQRIVDIISKIFSISGSQLDIRPLDSREFANESMQDIMNLKKPAQWSLKAEPMQSVNALARQMKERKEREESDRRIVEQEFERIRRTLLAEMQTCKGSKSLLEDELVRKDAQLRQKDSIIAELTRQVGGGGSSLLRTASAADSNKDAAAGGPASPGGAANNGGGGLDGSRGLPSSNQQSPTNATRNAAATSAGFSGASGRGPAAGSSSSQPHSTSVSCPHCFRTFVTTLPTITVTVGSGHDGQAASPLHSPTSAVSVGGGAGPNKAGSDGSDPFVLPPKTAALFENLQQDLENAKFRNYELQRIILDSPFMTSELKHRAMDLSNTTVAQTSKEEEKRKRQAAQLAAAAASGSGGAAATNAAAVANRDHEIQRLNTLLRDVTFRHLQELEIVRRQVELYDDEVAAYVRHLKSMGIDERALLVLAQQGHFPSGMPPSSPPPALLSGGEGGMRGTHGFAGGSRVDVGAGISPFGAQPLQTSLGMRGRGLNTSFGSTYGDPHAAAPKPNFFEEFSNSPRRESVSSKLRFK